MVFENLELFLLEESGRYEWFKHHLGNFVITLGTLHAAYMSNHIDDYAEVLSRAKPEQQIKAVEILKPAENPDKNVEKKKQLESLIDTIESTPQVKEIEHPKIVPYHYDKKILNQIKIWENRKLFDNPEMVDKLRYDKIGKKWEIGYGFTKNAIDTAIKYNKLPTNYKLPKTMTRKEADRLLEKVFLPAFEDMVNNYLKVPVSRGQMDALVSFAFNLGITPLRHLIGHGGYSSPEYPYRLNSGNYDTVPEIIRMYNKGNVNGTIKVIDGLDQRRKIEADWFNSN